MKMIALVTRQRDRCTYIEQKGIKVRHLGNNMLKLRMKKPGRRWIETHFLFFFGLSKYFYVCFYALDNSHTIVMLVFTRLLTMYLYRPTRIFTFTYMYICKLTSFYIVFFFVKDFLIIFILLNKSNDLSSSIVLTRE